MDEGAGSPVAIGPAMPNKFDLRLTRGAIQLARHFDRGPDGLRLPPRGGGGTRVGQPGPSTKGRVQTAWSAKSRRRMRFDFGALPWEMLGRRPVMITLTYPGEWELWVPDARTFVKHREALKERWRRKYGTPVGVWVTEFQRRGAPHVHMYVALPDAVSDAEYRGLQQRTIRRRVAEKNFGSYEARRRLRAPGGEFAMWLRTAWWEVVGSELSDHHGRGVDIATAFYSDEAEATANRVRVADYFWRESGKWAQKQPPEGFGPLKFYGRWGQKKGFNPVVTEAQLNEQAGLEIRRVLRRMQLGKMREAARGSGRKVTPRTGRSRGRDGLTVFNVDGTVVGPRLVEWAEWMATQKAAYSGVDRVLEGRWPLVLRGLSEFIVDPDAPPGEPDDEIPIEALLSQEDLEWASIQAHEEAIEDLEAQIDAQAAAWEERQFREQRKEAMRAADRRRRENRR